MDSLGTNRREERHRHCASGGGRVGNPSVGQKVVAWKDPQRETFSNDSGPFIAKYKVKDGKSV